jgi:antitoxin protein of toxin-antitoxin system
MGLSDKLKDLKQKAGDKVAEHQDQIRDAVHKAEQTADQKTGGKYHERIQTAASKADAIVDRLVPADGQGAADGQGGAETHTPAEAETHTPGEAETHTPGDPGKPGT